MSTKYKTVRRDAAHAWAHKLQPEAKVPGGRMFFRDDTIYSYGTHFPIACHVEAPDKSHVILFTTKGYSSTTAGHKSEVRGAIPSGVKVFHVEHPTDSGAVAWRKAMKDYDDRINDQLLVVKKSRSRKDYEIGVLNRLVNERNDFNKVFKVRMKPLEGDSIEKLQVSAVEAAFRESKRQKAEERAYIKRMDDQIQAWIRGEDGSYMPSGVSKVYLRVSGDVVETSRHVTFPVSHAKRAYKLVKTIRDKGVEWVSNGHTIKVGDYKIEKVSAKGDVTAGCHFLEWDVIRVVGEKLEAMTEVPDPVAAA